MGVTTRSIRLSDRLPHGWKTIKAHSFKNKDHTYYISPDGKRFLSMEAAKITGVGNISDDVYGLQDVAYFHNRQGCMERNEVTPEHILFVRQVVMALCSYGPI